MTTADVSVVRRGERRYPPLLRELHDPPSRLYVRGGPPELLAQPAVAVVGARSCSPYGAHVARSVGRSLAARIRANGAVVSEYPAGVEPAPWRFPARNRIIAGLARATIVVEARSRSGALGTADFALELGRDVFAVPGEITAALSTGTNDLLRQGAAPFLAVDDVLSALGLDAPMNTVPGVSPLAGDVLDALADGPSGVDDLVRATRRPSADVAAALVELELAGRAVCADGTYRVALSEGESRFRAGRPARGRTDGTR